MSSDLDLEAVKARHARLTDGDEYVHWHEWQRRVVDCAGDIPLLVAEVERLRAENEQLHIRVAVHPVELETWVSRWERAENRLVRFKRLFRAAQARKREEGRYSTEMNLTLWDVATERDRLRAQLSERPTVEGYWHQVEKVNTYGAQIDRLQAQLSEAREVIARYLGYVPAEENVPWAAAFFERYPSLDDGASPSEQRYPDMEAGT